jgi:hypothetical protein
MYCEGLISLIHKGGTSKEMLPLRYTSLTAFFASSFYELRLATLETKNAARLGGQHFFAEREGFEPSVPLPVRQFSKLFLSATQASLRYHYLLHCGYLL